MTVAHPVLHPSKRESTLPALPAMLLFSAVVACVALQGGGIAQLVALSGAFWVALADFRHRGGQRRDAFRFVAGMLLAAVACHLGWIVLHLDRPVLASGLLLEPAGFCVLFAPLGLLVVGPRLPSRRSRFLTPALGSLPLALATARMGCLAAGCCHGVPLGWGPAPTQALEIAGCAALSVVTRSLPGSRVPVATLAGLGVIRLLVEPWRAPDPLGSPILPTAVLAALLVAAAGLPLLPAAARRSLG